MRTAGQHGTLPRVLAEAAVPSRGYRVRWAGQRTRERFRVIPAVLLAPGTGPAVSAAAGPGPLGSRGGFPAGASRSSNSAAFPGVVFPLTPAALQPGSRRAAWT